MRSPGQTQSWHYAISEIRTFWYTLTPKCSWGKAQNSLFCFVIQKIETEYLDSVEVGRFNLLKHLSSSFRYCPFQVLFSGKAVSDANVPKTVICEALRTGADIRRFGASPCSVPGTGHYPGVVFRLRSGPGRPRFVVIDTYY